MRGFWDGLVSALGEAVGEVLGGLIGWGSIILLLLLLFFIIYFVMKKLTGQQASRPALFDVLGNIQANLKIEQQQPQVVTLGQAAIGQAEELQRQGKDLDMICRLVHPAYSQWGSLHQQVFRSAMEAALKAQREVAR
jgi:hypothetical protein